MWDNWIKYFLFSNRINLKIFFYEIILMICIFKTGPNLKVIGTMSVGYDHLNLDEIKARNIKVS